MDLASKALATVSSTIEALSSVHSHKTRCSRLAERLQSVEKQISSTYRRKQPNGADVLSAFQGLINTLEMIAHVVAKFSRSSWVGRCVQYGDDNEFFQQSNAKLQSFLPLLQIGMDRQVFVGQLMDESDSTKDHQLLEDLIQQLSIQIKSSSIDPPMTPESLLSQLLEEPTKPAHPCTKKLKSLQQALEQSFRISQPLSSRKSPAPTDAANQGASTALAQIPFSEIIMLEKVHDNVVSTIFHGKYKRDHVAIRKIRTNGVSSTIINDFVRDLEGWARLTHPNVAAIAGYSIGASHVSLVIEWLPTSTLRKMNLNTKEPFSWEKRLVILRQAASGLLYLHQQSPSITHQGFSSSNILISDDGSAKLSDMLMYPLKREVLAKLRSSPPASSACHIAPELVDAAPKAKISPSSDIFGVAIVLWETSTRQEPFPGYEYNAILQAVASGSRPDLDFDAKSPRGYFELLVACWNHSPAHRPSTADVHRAIESFDPTGNLVSMKESISTSAPGNARTNTAMGRVRGERASVVQENRLGDERASAEKSSISIDEDTGERSIDSAQSSTPIKSGNDGNGKFAYGANDSERRPTSSRFGTNTGSGPGALGDGEQYPMPRSPQTASNSAVASGHNVQAGRRAGRATTVDDSKVQEKVDSLELQSRLDRVLHTHADVLDLAGLNLELVDLANLPPLSAVASGAKDRAEEIGRLLQVTRLHMQQNRLVEMPSFATGLMRLVLLNASSNRLTALPAEVSRLAELRTLLVAHNSITALPDTLAGLGKLRLLGADGNPLVEPPNELVRDDGVEVVMLYLSLSRADRLFVRGVCASTQARVLGGGQANGVGNRAANEGRGSGNKGVGGQTVANGESVAEWTAAAAKAFVEALEIDPSHVPSLFGLRSLLGRCPQALELSLSAEGPTRSPGPRVVKEELQPLVLVQRACEVGPEVQAAGRDLLMRLLQIDGNKGRSAEYANVLGLCATFLDRNPQGTGMGTGTEYFRTAAAQGHMDAQFHLALRMERESGHGKGVGADGVHAGASVVSLLSAAAMQGHAEAQFHMGVRMERGDGDRGGVGGGVGGGAANLSEAARWYEAAAAQGHAAAQYAVGFLHERGIAAAPRPDPNAALRLYAAAQAQGHVASTVAYARVQEKLASVAKDSVIVNGRTIPRSEALVESVGMMRRAAEIGHPSALFHLGWCYEKGVGVAQSRQEAVECYTLAHDAAAVYAHIHVDQLMPNL